MRAKSRSALLAMAALSLGSLGGIGGGSAFGPAVIGVDMAQPGADQTVRTPAKSNKLPSMTDTMQAIGWGIGSGTRGSQRRSGPGWTNAHAKRVSRKARNVKRHRANSKG